jgi:hypothetical protein
VLRMADGVPRGFQGRDSGPNVARQVSDRGSEGSEGADGAD